MNNNYNNMRERSNNGISCSSNKLKQLGVYLCSADTELLALSLVQSIILQSRDRVRSNGETEQREKNKKSRSNNDVLRFIGIDQTIHPFD